MVPKDEQLQEWFSVCFGASTVDMVPKDILYLIVLVPVQLTWFQRTSLLVRFGASPFGMVPKGMIAVRIASFYFDTNLINMISNVSIN